MSRDGESIGGAWRFRFDPDDVGVSDGWAYGEAGAGWSTLAVPSSWNAHHPDDGPDVAWYRRRVSVPGGASGSSVVRVVFPAVATSCRVWVNGVEVGGHEGNWAPFEVVAGRAGELGEGFELAVRVDRVRPEAELVLEDQGGRRLAGGDLFKGFHDVLSRQVCGIWQTPRVRCTGGVSIGPSGVGIAAAADGAIAVVVEDGSGVGLCGVRVAVRDGARVIASGLTGADGVWRGSCDGVEAWSPEHPRLYALEVEAVDGGAVSDAWVAAFGFRSVTTEGEEILLNGEPVFLSGVLEWGHEPGLVMPAADEGTVRRRFRELRERGFNCVCLCMWYAPERWYEIAAEEGVLVWQEHPVWKSRMPGDRAIGRQGGLDDAALRAAYRERFGACFAMDRSRTAVVLVSATCEHERFDAEVASWWWEAARRHLPHRLAQIQTGFMHWTDPSRTDLYDEHTYENTGVWVEYLHDLGAEVSRLGSVHGRKPVVFGESILYVAWAGGDEGPEEGAWWSVRARSVARSVEASIAARDGAGAVGEFRERAARFMELGRSRQTEQFRLWTYASGLVHNHVRDVPLCPLGLIDGADRWRVGAASARRWASSSVLAMDVSGGVGLASGESSSVVVGLVNLDRPSAGPVSWRVEEADGSVVEGGSGLVVRRGHVGWMRVGVGDRRVGEASAVMVRAEAAGLGGNAWRLWRLPAWSAPGEGVAVADAPALDPSEREPAFEERRYSSGWGLPMVRWRPVAPWLASALPGVPRVAWDAAPGRGVRVLLANRLSVSVVSWCRAGGRVVHVPARGVGGCPSETIAGWGQTPFIAPRGPTSGVEDAVLEMLDVDLRRRWVRSIPTGGQPGGMSIEDQVEPYIRHYTTHDAGDRARVFDSLASARLGDGLLVLASFDLSTPAGRWLLGRVISWAASDGATSDREVDPSVVSGWAVG